MSPPSPEHEAAAAALAKAHPPLLLAEALFARLRADGHRELAADVATLLDRLESALGAAPADR